MATVIRLWKYSNLTYLILFIWTFFWVGKKIFLKKEQNHKFLNKSARSNGEVAKFSENDLHYDID